MRRSCKLHYNAYLVVASDKQWLMGSSSRLGVWGAVLRCLWCYPLLVAIYDSRARPITVICRWTVCHLHANCRNTQGLSNENRSVGFNVMTARLTKLGVGGQGREVSIWGADWCRAVSPAGGKSLMFSGLLPYTNNAS